jgi:hypothetical protein
MREQAFDRGEHCTDVVVDRQQAFLHIEHFSDGGVFAICFICIFYDHSHQTVFSIGVSRLAFAYLGIGDVFNSGYSCLRCLIEIMNFCTRHGVERSNVVVDTVDPIEQAFEQKRKDCKDNCPCNTDDRANVFGVQWMPPI